MRVRVAPVVSLVAVLLLSAAALFAAETPALITAVKAQDREAVRALLKQRVDVNARQPDGATALHWAVYREDLELIDVLIRAGASVHLANDVGMTPLLMACTAGQGAIVERLLAGGAPANAALASGETALMRAARAGSLAAVKALLARGADVNVREKARGQTPLMWAVANRHHEVVEALIARGADVHARSDVTAAVLNMGGSRSAGTGNRETTIYQIDQGGNTPLLFAARSGDLESARLLVAAGARVSDTGADGNTALIVAAHSGHASLASFLVDSGADVNAAPRGYTALHAAVVRGTLRDRNVKNTDPMAGAPLVKKLIESGATPNVAFTKGTPVRRWSHDFVLHEDWVGATSFWLAARFLEVDIMRVLGAAGADPNLASKAGITPLMAAAGHGYSRGGGEGAFIRDRRDFSSYNPVAAESGGEIPPEEQRLALEAVTIALDLGAQVKGTNPAGDTALHAAAALGMTAVVQQLMDRGADINARNKAGQSPLATAQSGARRRGGSEATVDLLRKSGAR